MPSSLLRENAAASLRTVEAVRLQKNKKEKKETAKEKHCAQKHYGTPCVLHIDRTLDGQIDRRKQSEALFGPYSLVQTTLRCFSAS